jgi:outer membrane protein assembly factor BamB
MGARRPILSVPFVLFVLSRAAGGAAPVGRLVASPEPGWPQWRGRRRDGVSDEKGLLQSWPKGGPKLLWKRTGLGRGYSAPVITGGSVYVTGDIGKQLHIFALDLEGRVQWRATNGAAWRRATPGSRSSCTVVGGKLYHLNAHGRAACLDAAAGRELWAVDVFGRFGIAKLRPWGLAESVVVDGERVIVTPAGRRAAMAALSTATGETVWASPPLAGDWPGCTSPILIELDGRRQVVGCTDGRVFGVDAEAGRLVWSHRVSRGNVDIAMPLFHGGAVFQGHVDHDSGGVARIDLHFAERRVEARRAWSIGSPGIEHCGAVIVGGLFYGAGHKPDWFCIDARTGEARYRSRAFANGPLIYADGRLYCVGECRGTVALVEPSSDGFRVAGRFTLVPGRKSDIRAHPVVCGGRLYLRCHDTLYCYDVRQQP